MADDELVRTSMRVVVLLIALGHSVAINFQDAKAAANIAKDTAKAGYRKAAEFEERHKLVDKTTDAIVAGYSKAVRIEREHMIGARAATALESGARKAREGVDYAATQGALSRAWSSVTGAVSAQYRLAKSIYHAAKSESRSPTDSIIMSVSRVLGVALITSLMAAVTHVMELWNLPCLVAKEAACASIVGACAGTGCYIGNEAGEIAAGMYYLRRARAQAKK